MNINIEMKIQQKKNFACPHIMGHQFDWEYHNCI